MKDFTLLLYGKSGAGKSTSLRTLPLEETYMINVEGKDLPFKHGRLRKHIKPKTLADVQAAMKEAVEDDGVSIVVVDSITMLGEVMVYNEFVKDSADSRGGWLLLRDWMIGLIEFAKKSNKIFIFIGLEMDILNEKEYVTYTTPKMVGSLKDSLPSHFTVVLRSIVRETENDIEYVFQTNRTKKDVNTVAKSPIDMFELYEPNDMKRVIEKMAEYYRE
jgi:energy-coupling factor transporter ATP-binding protein EcfA2